MMAHGLKNSLAIWSWPKQMARLFFKHAPSFAPPSSQIFQTYMFERLINEGRKLTYFYRDVTFSIYYEYVCIRVLLVFLLMFLHKKVEFNFFFLVKGSSLVVKSKDKSK